ncbi:hypothetical protein BDZ94DRAFT_575399 [Collybia nuda]|uniref:Uncharacterized protein n=1 Tax=Collybia nuda TaxID=64659 RepID=A0A9P6CJ17_9AGAR|nr:hypothetical protein BDZ94DRAFT_575399 [Collybia nuda]
MCLSSIRTAIYFSLPKLFFNSFLATLNARESLKERVNGLSEVVLSDISSRQGDYELSKESRASRMPRQLPMVVTINRQV